MDDLVERLERNAAESEHFAICPVLVQDAAARIRQLEAQLAEAREALRCLGGMEAFKSSRMVVAGQDDELIARIDFARTTLAKLDKTDD